MPSASRPAGGRRFRRRRYRWQSVPIGAENVYLYSRRTGNGRTPPTRRPACQNTPWPSPILNTPDELRIPRPSETNLHPYLYRLRPGASRVNSLRRRRREPLSRFPIGSYTITPNRRVWGAKKWKKNVRLSQSPANGRLAPTDTERWTGALRGGGRPLFGRSGGGVPLLVPGPRFLSATAKT